MVAAGFSFDCVRIIEALLSSYAVWFSDSGSLFVRPRHEVSGSPHFLSWQHATAMTGIPETVLIPKRLPPERVRKLRALGVRHG